MLTLLCLFQIWISKTRSKAVEIATQHYIKSEKIKALIEKGQRIKLQIWIILLIFQLFCDIIFTQVIQAAFTGNANLIAQTAILIITSDKEKLEELGIESEIANWDFQDWFNSSGQGNEKSEWVVDKNLLVRQKTLYIFEKATEGTFFQTMPYAVYGTGLCEAGYTAWYDYNNINILDADPIINLIGTEKEYNKKQAIDTNLWIFKNDGQTPAVGPFQFVGVYSKNKMRYQVDMDYSGKFDIADLISGNTIDVGDKSTDEVEFARPNPLYIPDAVYSYQHGLSSTYENKDIQQWYPEINQLGTEQQLLMRAQIAFCLYGWGEGNVTGKYEQNGHQLKTFSKELGDWLRKGNSIQNIVNYKDYWDQSSLKIVGYSKQNLRDWVKQELGLEITKEESQGTYVEMEGLYHIVIGYIEWMNLKDTIASAEKQIIEDTGQGDIQDNQAAREKVVEIAKGQLGKFKYKMPGSLKGSGPDNFTVGSTLDCQSWVRWCYWQAGFTFEAYYTGAYEGAQDLIEISRDEVQIADLQVVYPRDSSTGVGHVWMYIGDGKWAECTPTGGTRGDNWQMDFMTRNTSHYFTYAGFKETEQVGQSGQIGEWQNPVPGYRRVSRRYISKWGHGALDLAANEGTPIYAAQQGTVVDVYGQWTPADGREDMASYGNYVNIEHGNGVYTMYAHMVQIAQTVGQTVKAGDLIGYVGNTGNQYGAHLHFEIRVGGNNAKYREDPDNLTQYGIPSYLTIVQ